MPTKLSDTLTSIRHTLELIESGHDPMRALAGIMSVARGAWLREAESRYNQATPASRFARPGVQHSSNSLKAGYL